MAGWPNRSMSMRGDTMNRSRPLIDPLYRGSAVQDQTRKTYSTVKITTDTVSNRSNTRGAASNTRLTVPKTSATTLREIKETRNRSNQRLAGSPGWATSRISLTRLFMVDGWGPSAPGINSTVSLYPGLNPSLRRRVKSPVRAAASTPVQTPALGLGSFQTASVCPRFSSLRVSISTRAGTTVNSSGAMA